MKDIRTWRDLCDYLIALTPEELDQPVQIAGPYSGGSDCTALEPAICIGTVKEMEFERCRSSTDNKYHGEHVVLLTDHNPFSGDGAIAYDIKDAESPVTDHPVYGADGPTRREDQTAPAEVFSPAEYLRDELEARGWTREAFAHIAVLPLDTVDELLRGERRIGWALAEKLGAAFGTSAEVWMNLQRAADKSA